MAEKFSLHAFRCYVLDNSCNTTAYACAQSVAETMVRTTMKSTFLLCGEKQVRLKMIRDCITGNGIEVVVYRVRLLQYYILSMLRCISNKVRYLFRAWHFGKEQWIRSVQSKHRQVRTTANPSRTDITGFPVTLPSRMLNVELGRNQTKDT